MWSIIKTLYWSSRGGPGDPNPTPGSGVSGPLRDDSSVAGEIAAAGTNVGPAVCESDQRSARSGGGVLSVANATNGDISVSAGGVGEGAADAFTTEEDTETDETTEIFQNGVHLGLPSLSSKIFFPDLCCMLEKTGSCDWSCLKQDLLLP